MTSKGPTKNIHKLIYTIVVDDQLINNMKASPVPYNKGFQANRDYHLKLGLIKQNRKLAIEVLSHELDDDFLRPITGQLYLHPCRRLVQKLLCQIKKIVGGNLVIITKKVLPKIFRKANSTLIS